MNSESNRAKAADSGVTRKMRYAAVETVGMPMLMAGNEIVSTVDHSGAVIALVGGFVVYNLFRLFTS